MEVGIVGLPVSGKSTLFATLTGQSGDGHFGGGKVEVHRGVVKVPDPRLDELTRIFNPQKQVNATIEYIEVGGMESDTVQKGFDPQFLLVLKNTAALCVVIRAFDNEFHPHPGGGIDVARDVQTIEAEFLLSDLSIVENRIARLEKQVQKIKNESDVRELDLLRRVLAHLETETPLREMTLSGDEATILRGFQFLSLKPLVYVINIDENDIGNEAQFTERIARRSGIRSLAFCAKVEEEISQLENEDRDMFLEELGISEPALDRVIRSCFDLLGLISFFTVGEDECRSWNVRAGALAPAAAGVIHSDLERGFIRAEVIGYDEFMTFKSMNAAKEKGKLRLEGKSYPVQDGDIMNIRFNV